MAATRRKSPAGWHNGLAESGPGGAHRPPATTVVAGATSLHTFRYGPGATEWLIEVVDLETGSVVVSQVVDAVPRSARFFAPGWLAVYNDDGFPQYRMYRVGLPGLEQA